MIMPLFLVPPHATFFFFHMLLLTEKSYLAQDVHTSIPKVVR